MAAAEFGIPEGHTLLEGVAVMKVTDREGKSSTVIRTEGDPSTELILGLLLSALDRMREREADDWHAQEEGGDP